MNRFSINFRLALEGLMLNRVRSLLTSLGVIFGVSAVIAMLAIGEGAEQEVLKSMEMVGVNNILITPKKDKKGEDETEEDEDKKKGNFSNGLQVSDANAILDMIPTVSKVSPEILMNATIMRNGQRREAKLIGVTPTYFNLFRLELLMGKMFHDNHQRFASQVCIIGYGLKALLFSTENPIGKYVKCGGKWLQVIGVMDTRKVDQESSELGIRDLDMDVYIPLQSMLVRYKDRSKVTVADVIRRNRGGNRGQMKKNYHQLDRLVVKVEKTENLKETADIIARMLRRRHYEQLDFEISIPELLLKQQQETKKIFGIVLGVIAGISLLVGGIGIMNIMLASVLERVKEIGLRLAIGAKKKDVMQQFVFEAILISISGGAIGILLGVTLSLIVSVATDIPTVITSSSILISFFVSAAVGMVFGITPARNAAKRDPIQSLHYE